MLYGVRNGSASAYPQTFRYPSDEGHLFARCPSCGADAIPSYVPNLMRVEEGAKWPDILVGPWPLVVTEKVADAWLTAKLSGFTIEPIDVLPCTEKLRLARMPKYVGIRIEPWGIKPVPEKTKGMYKYQMPARPISEFSDLCITCGSFRDQSSVTVKSLELDMATWKGSDFCSWRMHAFVSEAVVQVALDNKFTSFHFTLPSQAWDVTAKSLKKLPKPKG